MVTNTLIRYDANYKTKKDKGDGFMCSILKKIENKSPHELLSEYGIDMTPPIDISKLMTELGISTISRDFSDVEDIMKVPLGSILGAAFSNKDNLTIFYRKNDSLHRKKFTIAHELAHCCLHCPTGESSHIEFRIEPFSTLPTQFDLNKEKQANIFAGQILIPQESLMKCYNQMVVASLADLSKIFDVSTSVMAARLDYLNLAYYKDSPTEVIL